MNRSFFIKPILSVFATVVFVFSAVPKIVFHEIFADHNYKTYYHIPNNDPHFDPPSASCDCICDWYDSHLDNFIISGIQIPHPLFELDHAKELVSFHLINEISYGLRGPPSIECI